MTFRHNNTPAIVTAMDRAIHELQVQRAYIASTNFNDAETIKSIARNFASDVCDPVLAAIAKHYTDAKPGEYDSIAADGIGDLIYDIEQAEQREREYERDEAADYRFRCRREDRIFGVG